MQAAVMEDSNVNETVQPQQQSQENNSPAPATAAAFSYDDLFPALPANAALPKSSNAPVVAANKHMRVGTSVITQVFHVPCEERKSADTGESSFGEGDNLRTCQQIMKETGAHIEISSGKDQSLTFLVKGKQSEVLDARRKILIHFQNQASKQLSIPKEHHRVILGKKAERLRELEKVTATKITVPNQTDESDVITISGTKEGIEKAEYEIRSMSNEQLKKAVDRISVPRIYHPFITGPFNENVSKMMEETGTKIHIPPPSVNKDEIMITGEKDAVVSARNKIEAIYKDMEKKCATVCVEVAKAQHRHIIGYRGSTINEILKLTGVYVEMPPPNSMTDTITLRGPQIALGNALTVVCQKANSVKTIELEAPSWIHKYIIGKKGASIKEFEAEYPQVNLEFIVGENKIKLEGEPDKVDRAVSHLREIVNNYVSNYSFVVLPVNPNHYKHIIGKAGASINKLKDELKINVNFEENGSLNTIRIDGPCEGVAQAQREIQEKIDKLENEKSKDVIIDRRLHRSIIGPRGEKIREFKDRYSQVNIAIPSSTENTDIIKIRGPKEDVDKCHKDLMKLVKEIQESSYVVDVPIFKQFHKYIIGKGGVNIKKIRDETQTKIDLPAEGDTTNEVIVITGKKENVLDAKERIQKIQNELANIVTEEIQIPQKFHNSIIGSGGKLITAIMEECGGVSIKIPPTESKSDKVTIRGPIEDVEKAKQQLLELAGEAQLASFTAEVRAKQQHHKFLIGKNGSSIRKIRESTGARIIFPGNNDEDKEVIVIIGKEDSVKKAKEQLETIIADIDNVTEGEITVDPKYHKHFLMKRGEILQRISDECGGVLISIPRMDTQSDRVTIKGAKECIEAAKQRIQDIVNDLDAQVSIEVVIPQSHHGNIMGPRGSRIQQVTSTYDVQIKIPDRNATEPIELNGGDEATPAVRQCDIITIIGTLEKCNSAKQALLDLIPITEEINVPFELHRSIIGTRGSNVRELMNRFEVHIEVSPPELKLDIIKISGTKANVADCKEALFQKVEEYEADLKDRELRSFEIQMDIDPDFHSKIIGRRGNVVNKLRADYDVNISLPKSGASDVEGSERIVTITGYEKNANECKEEILRMIAELNDMFKDVIEIDSRVHPRLIGNRGRNIKTIMGDFKVDIKFPRPDDENMNAVTIIGLEENVENAKDHLLNLEEEYLQDVIDVAPARHARGNDLSNALQEAFTQTGFVVQGAPWERKKGGGQQHHQQRYVEEIPNTQSQEDFPDFGGNRGAANNDSAPISSAWGGKR